MPINQPKWSGLSSLSNGKMLMRPTEFAKRDLACAQLARPLVFQEGWSKTQNPWHFGLTRNRNRRAGGGEALASAHLPGSSSERLARGSRALPAPLKQGLGSQTTFTSSESAPGGEKREQQASGLTQGALPHRGAAPTSAHRHAGIRAWPSAWGVAPRAPSLQQ